MALAPSSPSPPTLKNKSLRTIGLFEWSLCDPSSPTFNNSGDSPCAALNNNPETFTPSTSSITRAAFLLFGFNVARPIPNIIVSGLVTWSSLSK